MSLMAELGEGPPPSEKKHGGHGEGRGFGGPPGGPRFNQPPHLMNDIIRAGLELERSTPRVSVVSFRTCNIRSVRVQFDDLWAIFGPD